MFWEHPLSTVQWKKHPLPLSFDEIRPGSLLYHFILETSCLKWRVSGVKVLVVLWSSINLAARLILVFKAKEILEILAYSLANFQTICLKSSTNFWNIFNCFTSSGFTSNFELQTIPKTLKLRDEINYLTLRAALARWVIFKGCFGVPASFQWFALR